MLLVAVLALGPGVLPAPVGWLAVLVLLAIVATGLVATVTLGPVLWVVSLGLVAALVAWLASLALAFAAAVPDQPSR